MFQPIIIRSRSLSLSRFTQLSSKFNTSVANFYTVSSLTLEKKTTVPNNDRVIKWLKYQTILAGRNMETS